MTGKYNKNHKKTVYFGVTTCLWCHTLCSAFLVSFYGDLGLYSHRASLRNIGESNMWQKVAYRNVERVGAWSMLL